MLSSHPCGSQSFSRRVTHPRNIPWVVVGRLSDLAFHLADIKHHILGLEADNYEFDPR